MTRIVVTHSLLLAQQANRVMFMAKGKLIEIGNHNELLTHCSAYHDFVQNQGEQDED